jgi:hypothetical protein
VPIYRAQLPSKVDEVSSHAGQKRISEMMAWRGRIVNGDTVIAVLFLAGGLYWMAASVPLGFWLGFAPGTGFMPFVYGALLVLLSGTVLAGRLFSAERLDDVAESPRKPLTIILIVALAILGIETAGFVPAIIVTLLALFIFVERLPVFRSLGIAVATTAGLHFLFRVWLGVPLPQGPLGI